MNRALVALALLVLVTACDSSTASFGAADAAPEAAPVPPPAPTVDEHGQPIDWHANDFPSRPVRPRSEYCLEHLEENFVLPKGLYDSAQAPTSLFLRVIAKACKKNQPVLAAAALQAANAAPDDRARILFRAAHPHEAWDPRCEVSEIDAPKLMVDLRERFFVKDPPPYPFRHCHLEGPNWCAFDVGTWVFVRVLWAAEAYRTAPGQMPAQPDLLEQFARHEEWTDPHHSRCNYWL